MELEEAISKLKYELDKSKIVKKYQDKDRNDVKAKFEEYVEDGTYEQYFEKKVEG